MINSRQKGKRIERWFANALKHIFPDIRRNAGTQSQSGGVDLENTDPFNFEVKGGKAACIVKVRSWIEQAESEGNKTNYTAVLIKPEREQPYVIMPFEDWLDMVESMKAEKIF